MCLCCFWKRRDHDADEYVTRILYKTHKPVILAVNKVDNQRCAMISMTFMPWDWVNHHRISSVHGIGTGDVLDAIIENLPE